MRYAAASEPSAANAAAVLYTRPSGAGSKTPTTAHTPADAHAAATSEQNGPSSGSAAARKSLPNRTMVASGNTASAAPPRPASSSAARTRVRLTATSGLTGSWHNAIRMPPTIGL